MDARSSLRLNVNSNIANKLKIIASLASALDGEDFKGSERKKHHEASQLFYYCLMSVYSHLFALEILNKEESDIARRAVKYKSLEEAITHRIGILWGLMENPNGIKRTQNNGDSSPLNERKQAIHRLGQDYRKSLNQFKGELSQADSLTPELLLEDIRGINLAFIEMNFLFLGEAAPTPFLNKRLLSIAFAFEFIFQAERELRLYALHKAKFSAKDSTELGFYQKIFIEDESDKFGVYFSCRPLYDDLKKMIDAVDEVSFDDTFNDFKELCKNYPFIPLKAKAQSGSEDGKNEHAEKKKKKGHYDHKDSPTRGNVSAVFLDGSHNGWSPERRMDGDVASTPEELAANFGEKLNVKLAALRDRYLGENGEFSKIPAITQVLSEDQPLPADKETGLDVYAQCLQTHLRAAQKKPAPRSRKDTELLDLKIDEMLDALTAPSPKQRREAQYASTQETPSETGDEPAAKLTRTRSKSKPEESSHSSGKIQRKRSGSHLPSPAGTTGNQANQAETPPPVVTPGMATPPSTSVVAPPAPQPSSRKAMTVNYRKPRSRGDHAPAFKPAINMPLVGEYILIGVSIGLLVSLVAAAAVVLTYFAIHGGAAVLIPAFLATAKFLGGSTIGAWSFVALILAFPPVVGVLGAFHRWKHKCESLFSPLSTPTVVKGSTHSIRRASEPVQPYHSIEMRRPSQKRVREGGEGALPSVTNSPSTLYPKLPKLQSDAVAPERRPLVVRKKR